GIVRIDAADEAVTAVDVEGVGIARAAGPDRLCGNAPAAVVLQAAEGAVRPAIVHSDALELARREGVQVVPVGGWTVGDVDAAGVGAVGALLILHIGGLTGEAAAVGPAGRARGARFEDQVYVLLFGAALISQLHLVAGFLAGERLEQLEAIARVDLDVVDAQE